MTAQECINYLVRVLSESIKAINLILHRQFIIIIF